MFLLKKRLLRYGLLLALVTVLIFLGMPLIVSSGVRAWIWWQARTQNVTCTIEKIEAPFLHPVELRGVHLKGNAAMRFDLTAARLSVSLNLRSLFVRTRERAIASVHAQDVRGELHRNESGTVVVSARGWNTLQESLPASFSVDRLNLRIEDGPTVVLLRDLSLSASEIETGTFTAAEVRVTSPVVRQTFSGLRGATNWEGNRLTIAGLTLVRGIDVQSVTTDLSHLNNEQIGLEIDADTFGGKIRASITNEWRLHRPNWSMAGSATDISLEQTSGALGFTERVSGKLHASKFTFRGDPHDPTHAVASLWMELTDLCFHNRSADVIMLGAALYNRQVQLQQLYVKQRNNQLTLNGEAGFPEKSFDWFNPDFRGTISASIGNLGDLALLFGANAGDFAGEISIEGTMNAGDRKIGGHVEATGKSLSIYRTAVDTLAAKANLTANAVEVEQLELHRKKDFMRGHGKILLEKEHAYSGELSLAADDVADYAPVIPGSYSDLVKAGMLAAEWKGTGNSTSHSGTFHVHGHDLRLVRPSNILPFDAELEANYSPGNVFFRRAYLSNAHVSLNAFVTLADRYVHLQGVALDLNGKPKLRGNVFLPLSVSRMISGNNFARSLDAAGKVDVDVSLDPTDVNEATVAVSGRPLATGMLASRLSIFGAVDSLQGWMDLHARDVALTNDAARFSGDADMRLASGTMTTKAAVQFSGSSPVSLEAALPVRFSVTKDATPPEPISGSLNAPAVFLNRLPRFITRDFFRDGVASAKLVVSGTTRQPNVAGDVQLTNGKLGVTPLHLQEASGRLTFKGQDASVDFMNLANEEVGVSLHGQLKFADLDAIELQLASTAALVDLAPRRDKGCVNSIAIGPLPVDRPIVANIDRVTFHGGLFGTPWTVALTDHRADQATGGPVDEAAATRSFPLCRGAEGTTLLFGCEGRLKPTPESPKPRRRPKRAR